MKIFVTGGTGYIGQRIIPLLLQSGHEVRALARPNSTHKLPKGCIPVIGDALDRRTFQNHIKPSESFMQLVGVAHPSPSKGKEFRSVDLVSGKESVVAAQFAGIKHFIYISVAHPAPMMKDYIAVRKEVESLIKSSGMVATILRPWYVLGPGHRWPYALIPAYWIAERIPFSRETAKRLGLLRLNEMLKALTHAVQNPPIRTRLLEVPDIRGL